MSFLSSAVTLQRRHSSASTRAESLDQQPPADAPTDMPDDAAAWLRTHFDWTARARFLAAFTALLDLLVETQGERQGKEGAQ